MSVSRQETILPLGPGCPSKQSMIIIALWHCTADTPMDYKFMHAHSLYSV